uniref:DNL-type domain-containing protein n=1 Tax=Bionectria ochroleuca TaxID=29856 RepID=A0A8H7N9V7_BIOOC
MSSRPSRALAPLLRTLRQPVPYQVSPLQNASAHRLRSANVPLPRLTIIRAAHSIPKPPPVRPREPTRDPDAEAPRSEGPRPDIKNAYYQLSFTCVPCGHRSHHNVSKQGYHTGSTLITCPECRNRHVISDHLGIFGDRKITIEDLMREKGQLVKRGSLGEDGDIEFWPEDAAQDGQDGDPSGQSGSRLS